MVAAQFIREQGGLDWSMSIVDLIKRFDVAQVSLDVVRFSYDRHSIVRFFLVARPLGRCFSSWQIAVMSLFTS